MQVPMQCMYAARLACPVSQLPAPECAWGQEAGDSMPDWLQDVHFQKDYLSVLRMPSSILTYPIEH